MKEAPRVFKDSTGKTVSPTDSIFPILTGNPETGKFEFIGTGFFIHQRGGFVTAKHVMFKKDGSPINPFFAIQTMGGEKHFVRTFGQFAVHPQADIVVGTIQPKTYIMGKGWEYMDIVVTPFELDLSKISIDDLVKTFAYPLSTVEVKNNEQVATFKGAWESGVIQDYFPGGRDKTLLPGKCFQTSMTILGGASGGPVIKDGAVIGVNSTGYDDIPVSFITPISEILDLEVFVERDKTMLVKELVELKWIPIR